ncbi:unnamed protein product, partial [Vitis vinifera]
MAKITLNRAFNYSMSKEAMMIQRITHMSSFQLPPPRLSAKPSSLSHQLWFRSLFSSLTNHKPHRRNGQ